MKQPTNLEVKLTPPQVVDTTTLRMWWPAGGGRLVGLLLAPAAGSGLDERVLAGVARNMATRGVTTGTFNFAYRQAGGRRPPDRADRLQRAFRDVLGVFRQRTSTRAVVLGGRSMGGRIASMVAAGDGAAGDGAAGDGAAGDGAAGDGAAGDGAVVAGVVCLAYPLCPYGRGVPDPRRTAHWPRIAVPVLFVHGDRDRLCPVVELDLARREHLTATAHCAHVVAGADHGFTVHARDERTAADVGAEVVDTVDAWLRASVEED